MWLEITIIAILLAKININQAALILNMNCKVLMEWKELEKRILAEIQPGHRGISKCYGNERRAIISNDGDKISMRTGIRTDAVHTITYEMIRYALDRISSNEVFDSSYFRTKFGREYRNAPCRYSMVGGVLVEMGFAKRYPSGRSCYYTKSTND